MPDKPGRLVLRADAGPTIGAGHVMRCLAIAQAWERLGGKALLIARTLPEALRARLTQEGVEVSILGRVDDGEDALRTSSAATEWVVVDSYQLGDDYRRRLIAAGKRVAALNDFEPINAADLVLNANPDATAEHYAPFDEETNLLLGPRYCLLREEFAAAGSAVDRQTPPRRLLITAGGADPTGLSATALSAVGLLNRHDLEVTVLVGGANPYRQEIEAAAAALPCPARVLFDCADIPAELRRADIALTAAGGSCWEMAHAGLPMLAVATVDNQLPVAKAIAAFGAGIDLDARGRAQPATLSESLASLLDAEPDRLRAIGAAGRRMIDGRGADRIAALMASRFVRFRRATLDDAQLLWSWRNDPAVRSASLTTGEIPYDRHCAWLKDRLRREDCRLLIAVDDAGTPFGQARFDGLGESAAAVISVSLATDSRGRGLGSAVVRQATEHILGRRLAASVEAVIRPENTASRRTFVGAGYRPLETAAEPNAPMCYTTATNDDTVATPHNRAA